jgi:outer membrane lipoprotein-sorting protein
MNTAVSGPISRPIFQRVSAIFLLSLAMVPTISFAAEWGMDQLMQSLATTKSSRATFVEKKYIAMLDRPLESSGELLYVAPDRLEKRTIKPKPESMLIDGEILVIERAGRKRTLQIQDYPELASFIDSVRGTLAGDRKALELSYKLKLEGDVEHWTLTLIPTNKKMAATIQQILIAGSRGNIATIDVIQSDQDHSLMTIERVQSQ